MAKKDTGKWAWLRQVLNEDGSRKYPTMSVEPEYAEVVAAMMAPHRDKTLDQLAERLNTLEAIKEIQEKYLSKTNAEIIAVERLMDSAFEKSAIEKLVVGGYAFGRKPEPAPKVTDPAAWLAHVKEHMPEILTVNYQTMRSIVSKALEANDEIPPGIEVEVRPTITRKKG